MTRICVIIKLLQKCVFAERVVYMCKVISRGIEVCPGPHFRMPTMNDAVAKQQFDLHYFRIGQSRTYRVYQGSGDGRKYLGVVLGWFGSRCWGYIPVIKGVGDRWYLAPTRFEALNAYHHFC